MAITPVGFTGTPYSATGATTRNIVLPTGIVAGDFIIIWSSTQDSASPGAPTAPGFTQRWSLGHASAFRPLITCLYKVAVGTESGTTVTLTWGSSLDNSLVCGVFRGVNLVTPFDATQTGPTNGTSNPDPAAITTVTDNAWVLVVAAANRPGGLSTPTISDFYTTGFTQVPDERGLVVTYRERAVAAAGDPTAWAWTPLDHHTTVTDALRPAPSTIASAGAAVAAGVAPGASVAVVIPPVELGPAALHFADGGHTNPRVEVAFNHSAVTSPTEWVWTDLSDRLRSRLGDLATTINRGRADESAEPQPSNATVVLDNSDGALTPGFAMSPWWPDVDVGLPLRIWDDGTTTALVLPGIPGAVAWSPDHADFDITGDIDVRLRIDPAAWSIGTTYVDGALTLGDSQELVSKWATGARSWLLQLFDAGFLDASVSADGTTSTRGSAFPTLAAALRPIWIGWTLDVDNGDGDHQHTFYRYDGDTPPDDITTWTVVAVDVDTGTTSLHSGAGRLEIGGANLGADAGFAGRVLAFELRDGINGDLVANPDFTAQAHGTTSFTDAAGKLWSLAGAAAISRRQLRFCGEIAEIDPTWPYGNNQPLAALDDERPTESRVAITAAGVLRRLTRGRDPLRSTLARKVPAEIDNVTAYWPCEEGRLAVQLSAGIMGHGPLNAFGLDMASVDTLPASAPLPKIPADGLAIWQGAVPAGPSVQWAVEMVLFIETPETDPTYTQILGISTAGSIARWAVAVSDTNIRIVAYDSVNAEIHSYTTGLFDIFDKWVLFRLDATQVVDLEFGWTITVLDTGGGAGDTDTIIGQTMGAVTGIDTHVTGPPDGMSFGHIIVHDGALGNGWLAGADTAWAGESAAHRFFRLCSEEGIPASVVGDPLAVSAGIRGDLAASQAMGPQARRSLPELLFDCVAIDLAVLIETRGIPGLIYRCRTTLEDQAAQLALNAAANEIVDLDPKKDNQAIINELTVTSTGGSSAIADDQLSVLRHGRYSDSVEVNGVGGVDIQSAIIASQDGLAAAIATQNTQQAGWRLALATTDGMRYPTLVIDLGTAPQLIDTWLATALGDRVTLTGLPVQHPTDIVELLIQHISETTTPTAWIVELTVTPGEPWMTGELVE